MYLPVIVPSGANNLQSFQIGLESTGNMVVGMRPLPAPKLNKKGNKKGIKNAKWRGFFSNQGKKSIQFMFLVAKMFTFH
jgi:hypothetical protein